MAEEEPKLMTIREAFEAARATLKAQREAAREPVIVDLPVRQQLNRTNRADYRPSDVMGYAPPFMWTWAHRWAPSEMEFIPTLATGQRGDNEWYETFWRTENARREKRSTRHVQVRGNRKARDVRKRPGHRHD